MPIYKRARSSVGQSSRLISILQEKDKLYTDLLDWLLKNELEVFLYLEKDKISEDIAQKVFIKFLTIAEKRETGINLTSQELDKLSNLISFQSTKEILISRLESDWGNVHLIRDLLMILQNIKTHLRETRNRISQILTKNLFERNHPSVIYRSIIYTIPELRLDDNDLIKKIIKHFRNTDEESLKASLLFLIERTSCQSTYFEFLIESLEEFIARKTTDREILKQRTISLDLPWALSSVIVNIQDVETFLKVIDYFIKLPGNMELLKNSFVEDFIENAWKLTDKNEEKIWEGIFNLYVASCENHALNQGRELLPFFEKTNSKELAFSRLVTDELKRTDLMAWNILPFYSRQNNSLVIDLFLKGKIEKRFLQNFLNSGSESGKILVLKEKLEEITGEDFSLPPSVDWKSIREEKKKRDIQVIFYKDKYLAEVEKLEKNINQIVTVEKVKDIRFKAEHSYEYSNVVLYEVISLLEEKLSFKEAKKKLNERDWDQYFAYKFYDLFVQGNIDNNKIKTVRELLDEQEVEILREWCFSNLDKVDFRNELETKEDGLSSTSYVALLLWLFQIIFKFEYPKYKLLEMISYEYLDFSPYGLEHYEEFLTTDEILDEVFRNLERGLEDRFVIQNHLNYALSNRIEDILFYTSQIINDSKKDDSIRKNAVDVSLKFEKGTPVLFDLLEDMDEGELYWYIVDKLLIDSDDNDLLVSILSKKLKHGEESNRINAAARLILLQNIQGLQYYLHQAKKENQVPIHKYISSLGYSENPVTQFKNADGLDELIQLLELDYHDDFNQSDYRRISQVVKSSLTTIALQSEKNLQLVTNKLIDFIDEKKEEYPNLKYLYNYVDDIEKKFYLNKSQELNLESAISYAEEVIQ